MSTVIVMVPIHADGYFLGQDRMAAEAFADFSRLPYANAERDINADTPNLSESILSVPFQNNNLTLGQGMHLHWSLPDALTKGKAGGTPDDFYAVPNRWLVTRKSTLLGDMQWIVESDYLHTDSENTYGGITYPLDTPKIEGQRHGFLGRRFNRIDWQEDGSAERVSRLTAVGYGEPTFAAFYPNCHSVFGCFDPQVDTQAKTAGLSYQIIGWYSDSAQDPVAAWISANPSATNAEIVEGIYDNFTWNVTLDSADTLQGMVCYADLQVDMSATSDIEDTAQHADATVSVGSTGTEALSAFLADDANSEADATARIQLEEQLENLLLQTKLSANDLDLGARFVEARHEKGFVATRGGSLYEVHPASADANDSSVDLNLPPGLETTLSELNLAQQSEDEAGYALESRRQQLYADWSKYMVTAYPPNGIDEGYPDVDAVQQFIASQDIPAIQDTLLDQARAQIATAELLSAMQVQVNAFNDSTVESSLFLSDLTADPVNQGRIVLTNATFPKGAPFATQVTAFNGTDANLTMNLEFNQDSAVKSLSMWVNLAGQNESGAALLSTQALGKLIAEDGILDFWDTFAIDGVEQPSDESLKWSSLPKEQWFHLYVEFSTALENTDLLYLFSNGSADFAAGKLGAVRVFSTALSEDERYFDQNMLGQSNFELKRVAGLKFWQPTEPVLLIEGEVVEPTVRHGADGRLTADKSLDCDGTTVTEFPLEADDLDGVLTAIAAGASSSEEQIGYRSQAQQPWNPFLLEWEAEIHPMSESGNLNIADKSFGSDFLTTNFSLDENSPELTVQNGKSVISAAATYTGRAILTPYAKTQLLSTIVGQLNGLLEANCYQVIGDISDNDATHYATDLSDWFANKPTLEEWFADDAAYDTQMTTFEEWYLGKPVYSAAPLTLRTVFTDSTTNTFDETAARLSDFNYALIKAYQQARSSHFISQALSGFNNALLMHQQVMQLPVEDPLGFEDYQTFTNQVAEYVADNNNLAALPLNDFLPIRSGAMRLTKLTLIDSFGQSKELDISNLIKAGPMETPTTPVANLGEDDVWLAPRFVQPARLNFRWLSANSGTQELNSHPDSTPICGWLLANNLDNSLDVYDADGFPIGVIDQEARWRAVPGTDVVVNPKNIANETLRKIVERLALVYNETDTNNEKRDFLQAFISTTDAALADIDPETYVHHNQMSLLMGRPLAIVRANLGLELKGDPAIHHGWVEFLQDLGRTSRDTNAFDAVAVPVRIGERGQLNDGTVGYWQEDTAGELGSVFHTTAETSSVSSGAIHTYEADALDITLNLGGDTTALTLLVDPRGDFHATTGLLPVQSLYVPQSLYADALQRINITFLTAPILTGAEQIALPLPNELGYEWSWLAKDRFNWTEVARQGVLRKDTLVKAFDDGEAIWTELLAQGWITAIDRNRARIVPLDQRTESDLSDPMSAQTKAIEALLDAGHIVPPDLKATFSSKQVLKEGWLKLSPNSNK
ncbi:MAG: hypothetical protein AAF998_03610 [Bacteroidota bacterium]